MPVNLIPEYERGLYERMASQHAQVLEGIRTTGALSDAAEQELAAALEAYTADFLKLNGQEG